MTPCRDPISDPGHVQIQAIPDATISRAQEMPGDGGRQRARATKGYDARPAPTSPKRVIPQEMRVPAQRLRRRAKHLTEMQANRSGQSPTRSAFKTCRRSQVTACGGNPNHARSREARTINTRSLAAICGEIASHSMSADRSVLMAHENRPSRWLSKSESIRVASRLYRSSALVTSQVSR